MSRGIINFSAVDGVGQPLAGITIAVLGDGTVGTATSVDTTTQPGSPLATLYAGISGATGANNPAKTDGLGNLAVCVDGGYYVLQIYGAGIAGQQIQTIFAANMASAGPTGPTGPIGPTGPTGA